MENKWKNPENSHFVFLFNYETKMRKKRPLWLRRSTFTFLKPNSAPSFFNDLLCCFKRTWRGSGTMIVHFHFSIMHNDTLRLLLQLSICNQLGWWQLLSDGQQHCGLDQCASSIAAVPKDLEDLAQFSSFLIFNMGFLLHTGLFSAGFADEL